MWKEDILKINSQQILESEKLFRTKFINSLAGIRQIALIGTKSKDGRENVAIFNSLIHLGANPPLFGFISRPDSVERDTLRNIKETSSYTINYLDKKWMKNAHKTSARYPKEISEFSATDFSAVYICDCIAPFVKEADLKIEMKMKQILNIEINNTKMIIGTIESVQIPKNRLAHDGLVLHDHLLVSGGLDSYYSTKFMGQLPYAKP